MELHVAFGPEDNMRVSEVWDCREQLQAFGETLMPILTDIGIEFSANPRSSRCRTSSSARPLCRVGRLATRSAGPVACRRRSTPPPRSLIAPITAELHARQRPRTSRLPHPRHRHAEPVGYLVCVEEPRAIAAPQAQTNVCSRTCLEETGGIGWRDLLASSDERQPHSRGNGRPRVREAASRLRARARPACTATRMIGGTSRPPSGISSG